MQEPNAEPEDGGEPGGDVGGAAVRGLPLLATAAVLGLAAIGLRTLEATVHTRIFNDGPRFVEGVGRFLAGDWSGAIADSFHPLTALCGAAVSAVLGLPPETAAEVVSIASGGIGAVALFALTRALFDDARLATIAGLAFAVHPRMIAIGAGVQSDGLYLALFLIGAWLGWRALESRQIGHAALAGLVVGLAYLTRPEGLVLAVGIGLFAAIDLARTGLRSRARGYRLASAHAKLALGFGAALALAMAPYVVAMHAVSGEWVLTQKKSAAAMTGIRLLTTSEAGAPEATSAAAHDARDGRGTASAVSIGSATNPPPVDAGTPAALPVSNALQELLGDAIRALTPVALLLVALGIRPGRMRRETWFVLSLIGVGFAVLLSLQLTAGYVSRRHWLPYAALALPFAARGLVGILDFVSARHPWLSNPRVGWAFALAVVGASAIDAAQPSRHPDKEARRQAALWLRENASPRAVAARRARVAYYAGAEYVALPVDFSVPEQILSSAQSRNADYLIIDSALFPNGAPLGGARELHRVAYPGGSVSVFSVPPRP